MPWDSPQIVTSTIAAGALALGLFNAWYTHRKDREKLRLQLLRNPRSFRLVIYNVGPVPAVIEHVDLYAKGSGERLQREPSELGGVSLPLTVSPYSNTTIHLGLAAAVLILMREKLGRVTLTLASGRTHTVKKIIDVEDDGGPRIR